MSHNSFSNDTRFLFSDCWKCWHCSKNTADSAHHIVGRGSGDSEVEQSALNFAPLCNQSCHLPIHGKLRTDDMVSILLNKTYNYLMEIGYQLKEIDVQFLDKYAKYYE